MSKNHKTWALLMVALLLVALVGVSTVQPQASVSAAAPQSITTPVAITQPATDGYITFNPFNASAVTADTTSTCFDVASYSKVDLLYSIDQTDVNTVTLSTKWSIDGTTKADGVNIVADNAADATDMVQLAVFGKYFCVYANVTNTNAVTITAQAIAK